MGLMVWILCTGFFVLLQRSFDEYASLLLSLSVGFLNYTKLLKCLLLSKLLSPRYILLYGVTRAVVLRSEPGREIFDSLTRSHLSFYLASGQLLGGCIFLLCLLTTTFVVLFCWQLILDLFIDDRRIYESIKPMALACSAALLFDVLLAFVKALPWSFA